MIVLLLLASIQRPWDSTKVECNLQHVCHCYVCKGNTCQEVEC